MTDPDRVPPGASPPTEALHPDAARSQSGEVWLSLFDATEAPVSATLSSNGPEIGRLAAAMARSLASGGRVLHIGAGTSGRLGVLDAAEWGPTFGLAPGRVIGRIAGGGDALARAVEGAEDDAAAGRAAVTDLAIGPNDLVVAISASGGAAFVHAALDEARSRGATCAAISASPVPVDDDRLLRIELDLGPELLAGSTRLSAATATHRVLQRASCLCALELGWIHRGRMVEMRPTNRKLRARSVRIVAELAAVPSEAAADALSRSDDDIKVAILVAALGLSPDESRDRLARVGRHLSRIDGLPE